MKKENMREIAFNVEFMQYGLNFYICFDQVPYTKEFKFLYLLFIMFQRYPTAALLARNKTIHSLSNVHDEDNQAVQARNQIAYALSNVHEQEDIIEASKGVQLTASPAMLPPSGSVDSRQKCFQQKPGPLIYTANDNFYLTDEQLKNSPSRYR